MAGRQDNNAGWVNYYIVNPANDPEEDVNQVFNDNEPPPPPPLMRQNATSGPRIRTVMNHNLPPIIRGSGLSVFRDGHHVNIGTITGNVATFNCYGTYTQAVEQVWVQQPENGQWYMTVICNRLPALAPAPVPAPVHNQMQEPMAG
jgi:hypothetical protein